VFHLHLLPRELLLHMQVQPDERKRQRDRLRVFIRVLCRERVDDMLVNESGIAEAERVRAQFVVRRELYFIQLRTRSAIFSGVKPR
jgi:hypothetical protein